MKYVSCIHIMYHILHHLSSHLAEYPSLISDSLPTFQTADDNDKTREGGADQTIRRNFASGNLLHLHHYGSLMLSAGLLSKFSFLPPNTSNDIFTTFVTVQYKFQWFYANFMRICFE